MQEPFSLIIRIVKALENIDRTKAVKGQPSPQEEDAAWLKALDDREKEFATAREGDERLRYGSKSLEGTFYSLPLEVRQRFYVHAARLNWNPLLVKQLRKIFLSDQMRAEYLSPSAQQQAVAEAMDQDSFLTRDGVAYMPLADAARYAGVHRETLLTWVKNRVTFEGEAIEALYFEPTGNHFISKRSVERMVNRFERWPLSLDRPSGIITGKTEDSTGYLSVSEAARVIGVADVTLRKWVRQGSAPLNKPLDVVRETSSGYFYIQHQDVLQLAEHVKAFGVSRGGRPQISPALP